MPPTKASKNSPILKAYEAEAVSGIEDAADHPERAVRTSEDRARSDYILPEGRQ
jgi:hypothetical protein